MSAEEEQVPRRNLFVASKYEYVRGGRPSVQCILCGILAGDPAVANLTVHTGKLFSICLNLYPYSPGHLMIYPHRHIKDPREMTAEETLEWKALLDVSMDVLEEAFRCHGFNVGLNLGVGGGASIAHLHWHLVPRFRNELGFMDIIGGAKIIIADPNETQARLRNAYAEKFG
jgi:ATP adenylyltransferase